MKGFKYIRVGRSLKPMVLRDRKLRRKFNEDNSIKESYFKVNWYYIIYVLVIVFLLYLIN